MKNAKNNRTQKGSLSEKAFTWLKNEIMENRMPPGSQAFESDLSDLLDMSRTPVREAMIRLQNEGLIEILPRRGLRVLPLRLSDLREIYEVLNAVECEAITIITKRRPAPAEIDPLDKAASDMEKAMKEDDLDAWAAANERFHKSLLKLCQNKRLMNIGITHMDQEHRATKMTILLRDKPIKSTKEHRSHVKAILNGNPAKAREIYRQHRDRAMKELVEILQRFKLQNL